MTVAFRLLLLFLLLAAALAHGALVGPAERPFSIQAIASFDDPWAMTFLPDGRLLVTEREGRLLIVTQEGDRSRPVIGVPEVAYGGQGGLGDVALHPDFSSNGLVYLSYAEAGRAGTRGAAMARAQLEFDHRGGGRLRDLEVSWRQYPKVSGYGHYGHRLLFGPRGYLWIASGERQKFSPAQDMHSNLGKVLRLMDDGRAPQDNPFVDHYRQQPEAGSPGVHSEIWSLGHRNPLGMAFDDLGNLWVVEMGPAGGDELNLIRRGSNYGYPLVSNGDHYDGRELPDHSTRPEFSMPAVWWTPVISPGDMMIYKGERFPDWRGDALIASLSSRAIIRVGLQGDQAREIERYDMGQRIRSIREGPEGDIWILEDGKGSRGGELLRLSPR